MSNWRGRIRDYNEEVQRGLFALYDEFLAEKELAQIEKDADAIENARLAMEEIGWLMDEWYELRNGRPHNAN